MGVSYLWLIAFLQLWICSSPITGYDGCMIRYGRRGCRHRILTGVLVTCDGRKRETVVPQNLPKDTVYLSMVNFRFERLQRENFTRFTTVECMTIMDSGITAIDRDAFAGMELLYELVLENTLLLDGRLEFMNHPDSKATVVSVAHSPNLREINVTATQTLRQLRTLDLRNNAIERINGNIFTELRNLENIDLSDNRLVHMDWLMLNEMTKLNQLYLSGNRFQTIPDSVFNVFFAVKELTLGGNPFHCNCKLKWLREFYDISVDKTVDFESITCSSPMATAMAEVNENEFVCSRPSNPVVLSVPLDNSRVVINCTSTADPAPSLTLVLPDSRSIIAPPSVDLSRLHTVTPQILASPGAVKCEATNSEGQSSTVEALPGE